MLILLPTLCGFEIPKFCVTSFLTLFLHFSQPLALCFVMNDTPSTHEAQMLDFIFLCLDNIKLNRTFVVSFPTTEAIVVS